MSKTLNNTALCLLYIASALFIFAYGLSQILFGGWWYPFYTILVFLVISLSLGVFSIASLCNPSLLNKFLSVRYLILPLLCLIFLAYLLICNIYGYDTYLSRQHSYLMLASFFGYIISYFYLSRGRFASGFILFFILSCIMQVGLVFYQYYSQGLYHPLGSLFPDIIFFQESSSLKGSTSGYVSGTFGTRGTLSLTLMLGIIFALSYSFWGKSKPVLKILLFWLVIVLFGALSITMSRAGYVGVFVGLICFGFLTVSLVSRYSLINRWVLSITFLVLIIISFVLVIVFYQNNVTFQLRLAQIFDDPYRESLWSNSLYPLLRLNPTFGMGGHSFDLLSLKYLSAEFSARHVFVHNDWLQLLFEFGWVGLVSWVIIFTIHLIVGLSNIYKIARNVQYGGSIIPQDDRLAILIGSFCSVVAFGSHSLFEYQANVLAPAVMLGVCLGFLGSLGIPQHSSHYLGKQGGSMLCYDDQQPYRNALYPRTLFGLVTLTFSTFFSLLLMLWVYLVVVATKPSLKPEYCSLLAQNAILVGDLPRALYLLQDGAGVRSHSGTDFGSDLIMSENPRLLTLAAEVYGRLANSQSSPEKKLQYLDISAAYWQKVISLRPNYPYAYREGALASSWAGNFGVALPLHLRAIALDPQSGLGYEYFGLYYWLQKQYPQAKSLLRLGSCLPGSKLSKEYLPIVERHTNGVATE